MALVAIVLDVHVHVYAVRPYKVLFVHARSKPEQHVHAGRDGSTAVVPPGRHLTLSTGGSTFFFTDCRSNLEGSNFEVARSK